MNFLKTLAIGATALALGTAAYAADKVDKNATGKENTTMGKVGKATRSDDSTFAKLDKNKDGYISKTEAVGDARLSKDFASFDLNHDGKLNRAEYLAAAAKEDVQGVARQVGGADKNADLKNGSSTGSSNRK